jgi:hypothetical protein
MLLLVHKHILGIDNCVMCIMCRCTNVSEFFCTLFKWLLVIILSGFSVIFSVLSRDRIQCWGFFWEMWWSFSFHKQAKDSAPEGLVMFFRHIPLRDVRELGVRVVSVRFRCFCKVFKYEVTQLSVHKFEKFVMMICGSGRYSSSWFYLKTTSPSSDKSLLSRVQSMELVRR